MLLLVLLSIVQAFRIASSCQPKKKNGEFCGANVWCESGICGLGQCVAKLPTLNQPCLDLACGEGLGCQSGVCKLLPKAGEQCAESEQGPFLCREGLACYSGICSKVKQAEGSICSDFEYRCGEGLGCSFQPEQSVCIRLRNENESCTNYRECNKGLYCRNDKCEKLVKKRRNCRLRQCEEGLVCHPKYIAWVIPWFRCREPSTKKGTKCIDYCGGNLYCGEKDN